MEILKLGFPYSIFGLGAGLVVGGGVVALLFGVVTAIIIFLAIWLNIIRIDPILGWIQKAVEWSIPSAIQTYKENIRRSFTIDVDPSLLEMSKARTSIYMWHPHGLFSASVFFHVLSPFTQFPSELRPLSQVVLSSVCDFPGLHQLVPLWNITPSRESDMNSSLAANKSLSVVLGGVREILSTQPNKLVLNIAKKKGIFKLALQHGSALVPVITYGENEMYELNSWWGLKWINTKLLDGLGIVLPIPTLHCVQKWYTLLQKPFETPVHTVIGPPLLVEKVDSKHISEHMIEELREKYIAALKQLYSRTRPAKYREEIEII
jgi:2-acylglycerol O-acyltransferase 2